MNLLRCLSGATVAVRGKPSRRHMSPTLPPAVNGAHASSLNESVIEADHFLDRATSPSAAQIGDGLSRNMFVARGGSSAGDLSVHAPYAPSAVYGRIVF
jgi:hypothetical protein